MEQNREALEILVELHDGVARSAVRIQKLAEAFFRETDSLDQTVAQINKLIADGAFPWLKMSNIPIGTPSRVRVARELRIEHCGDGSIEFRFKVDFRITRVTIRLTPQLGGLLEFLCKRDPAKDGLAGWRTVEEVNQFIKGESQSVDPKRYLNGLMYRLKEALADAGLDRDMIQRNKKNGMRFSAEPPNKAGSEIAPGNR